MPSPTHSDPAFSSEGSGALSKGSSDKQTKLTSHLQSQGYKQSKLYICCQYMPSWHGQVLLNLFSIIIKKSSAKITFTQTQTTVFRSYNLDIQDFFQILSQKYHIHHHRLLRLLFTQTKNCVHFIMCLTYINVCTILPVQEDQCHISCWSHSETILIMYCVDTKIQCLFQS